MSLDVKTETYHAPPPPRPVPTLRTVLVSIASEGIEDRYVTFSPLYGPSVSDGRALIRAYAGGSQKMDAIVESSDILELGHQLVALGGQLGRERRAKASR